MLGNSLWNHELALANTQIHYNYSLTSPFSVSVEWLTSGSVGGLYCSCVGVSWE